jgi:hypothetical protein
MALAIVEPNGIEPVTPIIAFVVVAFVVVGLVAFVVVGLVAFVVGEGKRKVICAYAMFIEHSAAINKTAITIATNVPGTLVGLPWEFNI